MTRRGAARLAGMRRTPQPRAARRLDLAAILCLVAAMALFGRAWWGMRALEQVRPAATYVRGERLVWALDRHHDYLVLSRGAIALGVVGLGLAVAGATVTARDVRRRRLAVAA